MHQLYNICCELSVVENLIFVGGTSEYLQQIKSQTKDIDVIITDLEDLRDFYLDFKKVRIWEQTKWRGISTKRACFRYKGVLIDIWLYDDLPKFVLTKSGFKVQSVSDMIRIRKENLRGDIYSPNRKKHLETLKRLKQWNTK